MTTKTEPIYLQTGERMGYKTELHATGYKVVAFSFDSALQSLARAMQKLTQKITTTQGTQKARIVETNVFAQ